MQVRTYSRGFGQGRRFILRNADPAQLNREIIEAGLAQGSRFFGCSASEDPLPELRVTVADDLTGAEVAALDRAVLDHYRPTSWFVRPIVEWNLQGQGSAALGSYTAYGEVHPALVFPRLVETDVRSTPGCFPVELAARLKASLMLGFVAGDPAAALAAGDVAIRVSVAFPAEDAVFANDATYDEGQVHFLTFRATAAGQLTYRRLQVDFTTTKIQPKAGIYLRVARLGAWITKDTYPNSVRVTHGALFWHNYVGIEP